ncbi:wax ester synthase/diacylglycerol acyltransferase 4-like isoform X2 [Arachis duranensis]|uniref:Wax ester synthase/diacylglycerol acyltransferase 4-like isoform X2 n=1 Tax=Arachis duranensis TaxID=130453 RepID=A0A9C6TL16_ARADU|nr:wax ester synthase/diacylglycerol acyltransferase 4-like isoform X2 [Arachis duranensis]
MSMEKQYGEYLSGIAMEKFPKNKPLWEAHIIKYPTKNAAGTLIFKFHHAIGDGYTIMGLLLSSLQRHDDPSLPLLFPSKSSSSSNNNDETPIRSNVEGVEFLPITISHISFSIHHIKEIKSKLGVTINDVITGIIFYGIRLYMQDMDYKSGKMKSTAMAIVNTRNVKDYHTVQDMLKTNAKGVWGNHISYMHVSVPTLQDYPISNPLQFVKKAHNSIKRKKNSFATILTEKLLRMEHKLKGSEEVSKNIHRTLRNSSLLISNMVGPMEQMALANHPIKDLFFTLCGLPQSLVVTILSYMGMLRVTLATEEGFIDERKLVWNLNKAFEEILHEAENV